MTNIPSILIVDDEPDNFDVIETLLNDQDYQLNYVASGLEALDTLDLFNPDLILLDVMMPELDGIEVCRRIKALSAWQSIPIIMVTALTAKEDLSRCLAAGADDFISKPVHPIELRSRVHSMLRIKRQYDNIESLNDLQESTIQLLQSSLNELRGNLATSLSHELNTPLNGLLGMLGLLQDDLEDLSLDEDIYEMLTAANQSARRLEQLTKKFLIYLELELAENQPHNPKNEKTPFSKAKIIPPLQTLGDSLNRRNDLHCHLEEADVAISSRYLSIIVYELVENALKFSEPETPIKVSSQKKGEMLHVSIYDLGRGMTEEQIAKIDAFMQFERKTYEQQGIGMGLKIVKKIIEWVGGELSIHSIYQQETTIHFSLPLARSSRNQELMSN